MFDAIREKVKEASDCIAKKEDTKALVLLGQIEKLLVFEERLRYEQEERKMVEAKGFLKRLWERL